jgi:hypothetical protein
MTVVSAFRSLLNPGQIRFVSVISHIEKMGLNALPIVGLLSFLIGVVLAFQGADQLTRFGADIFTVDLLGVSIFREMGVLLAGCTGLVFDTAPAKLYRLAPKSTFDSNMKKVEWQLTIETPLAEAGTNTSRITVLRNPL